MEKKKILLSIGIGLALYLVSAGLSFATFNFLKARGVQEITSPLPGRESGFRIDLSAPKTETCPLNGGKFTKAEKEIWQTRRPLAVMIENHAESRPQSGLSRADIVYEAVAEGGITRLMGIFYCGAAAKNLTLAPVRSARTYFLDWVLEYDALYNHVGGAGRCSDETVDPRARALCQIGQYGIKDLDQFGIGFPNCYRNPDRLDHPVATEHQMICLSDNLYEIAKSKGWTNVDEDGVSWDKNFETWKFKDDGKEGDRPAAFSAEFTAWKGYEKEYGVRWEYDKIINSYKRFNGGVAHTDLDTGEQLIAKNVVLQFSKETGGIDEHAHLLYQTIGEGKAIIFLDGKKIEGTWRKKDRTSRTKFYDERGREIEFNRGQIWIEILPTGTEIKYQ
ncbi:DUF3048 domain-containing protein [Candidatus Gottesmanbacteria bacterium]|nr:DUF3048 domain-containing protein [Candidatus Gottesmanbacteria bacterium]MBI5465453.1 DUF3048 domain-containing protein [Candidatus Gottesmanbacteria bacterium]